MKTIDLLDHYLKEKEIIYKMAERMENFNWLFERIDSIDKKIDKIYWII